MQRRRTARMLLVAIGLCAAVLAAAVTTPLRSAIAAPWSPPTAVYFPQTGHHVEGGFLTYWRAHNGATLLGNPLTEQVREQGLTVQWFELGRLEFHPDAPGDSQFQLTALGRDAAAKARASSLMTLRLSPQEPGQAVAPEDPFARLPFALFPVNPDDHRFFPESGHTLSNSFKLFWEARGGLAQFGYPISEEFRAVSPIDGRVYTTQYFERARFEYHPDTSANYSVVLTPLGLSAARERGIDTAKAPRAAGVANYSEALFRPPPPPTPTPAAVKSNRPASIPAGVKWVDVNLSRQTLTAYDGDTVFWSGAMSSGRAGYETPTGTYSIFTKLRSQDMRGPDPTLPGGAYFQPDVPYVMYFADGGYALHGVYWHNNFGTPMSHGCVGLPVSAAAAIYGWAPYGTLIYIHY